MIPSTPQRLATLTLTLQRLAPPRPPALTPWSNQSLALAVKEQAQLRRQGSEEPAAKTQEDDEEECLTCSA